MRFFCISIIMVVAALTTGCTAAKPAWETVDIPTVKITSVIRVNASVDKLGTPIATACISNPYDTAVDVDLICHDETNELIDRLEERLRLPKQSDTIRRLPLWHGGSKVCYLRL